MPGHQTSATVLIVDDEAAIRRILARVLTQGGYATLEVSSAAETREVVAAAAPDVVLLDIGLPDGCGLDLARAVLHDFLDVAVVIISGHGDPRIACSAVDFGVYGYIAKPFDANAVLIAVYNALRRQDLERARRDQRNALARQVSERTVELSSALSRLNQAMDEAQRSSETTIQRLSRAIEYRDPETSDHVLRMSRCCGRLARAFGLDEDAVRTASTMHDVGKIGVPDAVLRKPGRLDADERRVMEHHTVIGHDLLSGSGSALLDLAATIALSHHERWNGEGYPNGLRGPEIPLVGRIAAVTDVFDALTTPRVYRRQVLSRAEALAYVWRERGLHFDPAVVDVLLATGAEVEETGKQVFEAVGTAATLPSPHPLAVAGPI